MVAEIDALERTGGLGPIAPVPTQDPSRIVEERQAEGLTPAVDAFARQDRIDIRGEAGNQPNIQLLGADGNIRSSIFDRASLQSPEERGLFAEDAPRNDNRVAFAEVTPTEVPRGLDTTGNSTNNDLRDANARLESRDQQLNPVVSELTDQVNDPNQLGPREAVNPLDNEQTDIAEQLGTPSTTLRAQPEIQAFDQGNAQRVTQPDASLQQILTEQQNADQEQAEAEDSRGLPEAAVAAETARESVTGEVAVRETAEEETSIAATIAETRQETTATQTVQVSNEREIRLNTVETNFRDQQNAQSVAEVAGDGGTTASISERSDQTRVENQVQERAQAGQLSGASPLSFGSDGSATFADGSGQRVNISA